VEITEEEKMGKKIRVRKFDVSIEKNKSVEKIIIGFLFSHIGLLLMNIGYAILGKKKE
jgi:hypothetical protein